MSRRESEANAACAMKFLGRLICVTLASATILMLVVMAPQGINFSGLMWAFVAPLTMSFLAALVFCSTFGVVEAIGRTPIWVTFIVTTAILIAIYAGMFSVSTPHGGIVEPPTWMPKRSPADVMAQHIFLIGLCMTCAAVGIGLHEAIRRRRR
jgi:hypothetical protein